MFLMAYSRQPSVAVDIVERQRAAWLRKAGGRYAADLCPATAGS